MRNVHIGNSFSFLTLLIAMVVAVGTVGFWQRYYPVVNSSIANTGARISFWTIIITAAVLAVGLVWCKRWVYAKRRELLLAFATLGIALVSMEAVLRIIDRKPLRFTPHQYLNYVGTPNYRSPDSLNMHNSLGLRGPEIIVPKPKGRVRIALLGGSTTYEDFVKDWHKDFARQLEEELRKRLPDRDIEVINAGLPGWDSWEDLINLEFRLLDLDLDLIIIYEGTNEVHARLVRPNAYKADNSGSKKQWERKPCLELTCLKLVQRITGLDTYGFDIIASSAALYPKSDEYNAILGMRPTEALAKNSPKYSERNLRNIIAVARENGIDVLLATWAWSDQLGDYAATSHYQQGFREQNDIVKSVGKLKDVPVYDFAVDMPKDITYWGDGRHNNEAGIALKAQLFATFMVNNNILR